MAITQRDRRNLYDRLEAQLGPDEAATLMELLPHRPADELVTTTHLHNEMGLLRSDLRTEIAELRAEIKADVLRVENALTLRIATLHTSMNLRVVGLATANVLGMATALAT